jgi:hypothetical protein
VRLQAEWGPQEGLGTQHTPAVDEQGTVVFRGVRARVGMFHGEVIKVVPHSRTGELLDNGSTGMLRRQQDCRSRPSKQWF